MKFQVAKRDLEVALQVVNASLSSSGSDISTHYLFRLTPPSTDGIRLVEVLTYSGRVFASSPVKGSQVIDESGSAFSIEGKRLKKWLASVPDAALEFSVEDAIVKAVAPKGSITFQSLDPKAFPFWDKQVTEAKVTGNLSASRMLAAFDYAKRFISDRESSEPNICVTEVRNGILWSTDKKAITLISVDGLKDSGFRIHGKSIGGFITFLGTFVDGTNVEVLEHDRALMLRRGDGAVFGESLFRARFPDLKIKLDEENQHIWTMPRQDVLDGIDFLTSGASWEDNRIRLRQGKGNEVLISMLAATGNTTELPIACKSVEKIDGADALPTDGFILDHECLHRILAAWKDEPDVKLGINLMTREEDGKKVLRGYVRFINEMSGDKYLTIHAWLR